MSDDRDAQIAGKIRQEIAKVKAMSRQCGWTQQNSAWHRAFGEIAGMYKILELIDPHPHDAWPNPSEIGRRVNAADIK